MKKNNKLQIIIKKYPYFFTVNFCFTLIGMYYSVKSNWGPNLDYLDILYVFLIIALVIFSISLFTILPLDLYYMRRDINLCQKLGIKYEEYVFMSENEKKKYKENRAND